MKKFVMVLGVVLLMVLSGCASAEEKRAELQSEFNSLLKLTIDGSGIDPDLFTYTKNKSIDYQAVSDGSYAPLEACDYIGNGKNKWVLRSDLEYMTSHTAEEVKAKSEHMRQVWADQGLEVRDVAAVNGMIQIAVDTDSGLTMGYVVSSSKEAINVSSTCTADLDPDKQ
ncbi:hypothetical protein IDM48_10845 [Rothia amarae]|uniref:DUF4853 domain-containing protein n=1 Tax=Rothia amarae TaxID=169480 RepID=A0A7H2BJI2_9MICC|nr:hypothetical protein [Rothia amarae]QNV39828.1 hypothetical protein IDM48_10845 [Rothia amarae]